MICFKCMSVLKIIPEIGNWEDIILMGSQIVVSILHLTEVQQVTHILLSSYPLHPPSLLHIPLFLLLTSQFPLSPLPQSWSACLCLVMVPQLKSGFWLEANTQTGDIQGRVHDAECRAEKLRGGFGGGQVQMNPMGGAEGWDQHHRVPWHLLCSLYSVSKGRQFPSTIEFCSLMKWTWHPVSTTQTSCSLLEQPFGVNQSLWLLLPAIRHAALEAENTTFQSPKMDVFSFGVLLVEICSAQFPDVADWENLVLFYPAPWHGGTHPTVPSSWQEYKIHC